MRRAAIVLGLFALLALVPGAECTAQAPATVPMDLADFLTALSDGQSGVPAASLSATLNFQWITCTSHDDCPEGQLCCYPCGIDGCDFVCMDPDRRGRCPVVP